ncbi:MAG: Matrixin [Parcubacteria group bacterium ADurb.Bin326]|nr:MAG: Matrixin [Parcubacteria group bacterium ADurb.Bin326]
MLRKFFENFLLLIIMAALVGASYYYREPLANFIVPNLERLGQASGLIDRPCAQPLTIYLAGLDEKFGISEAEAKSAIEEASKIWEEASGRDLFELSAEGRVSIAFVYDYRQETTDKLKSLGIVMEESQKSYDAIRVRYDALEKQYQTKSAKVEKMKQDFTAKESAYEQEVEKWNSRGGAPASVYNRLEQTRIELERLVNSLNTKISQANELARELNSLGSVLNKLASDLNLNVDKYNMIGGVVGEEFQEGVYIQDQAGRRIEVYEFADRKQLVRLLAHELGHALGLEHTQGKDDIMYYLNEAGNDSLTENDFNALRGLCSFAR